jgi:hypothetical protein
MRRRGKQVGRCRRQNRYWAITQLIIHVCQRLWSVVIHIRLEQEGTAWKLLLPYHQRMGPYCMLHGSSEVADEVQHGGYQWGRQCVLNVQQPTLKTMKQGQGYQLVCNLWRSIISEYEQVGSNISSAQQQQGFEPGLTGNMEPQGI